MGLPSPWIAPCLVAQLPPAFTVLTTRSYCSCGFAETINNHKGHSNRCSFIRKHSLRHLPRSEVLSAVLGAGIAPVTQQSPDLTSRSRGCLSPAKGQLLSCFRFEGPPSAPSVKNLIKRPKCHLSQKDFNRGAHIFPSLDPRPLMKLPANMKCQKIPGSFPSSSQGKLAAIPASIVHRVPGPVPGVPRGRSASGCLTETVDERGNPCHHLAAHSNTVSYSINGFPGHTEWHS